MLKVTAEEPGVLKESFGSTKMDNFRLACYSGAMRLDAASNDPFNGYFNGWPGADMPPMMSHAPSVLRQVCVHRNATTSLLPI